MKKIAILAVVAVFAIGISSCSKSYNTELSGQAAPKQTVPIQPDVNVVSNWVYPGSFAVETDRFGSRFIKGSYSFTAATQISYDKNSHVELAYVKIPTNQRIPYRYQRLPSNINVVVNGLSSDMSIDYSLDPEGLKLYYQNTDYAFLSRAVDQTVTDNWVFRYIVIPKAIYQATNVDWNDLRAVSVALNFSL
jgi:hypothetical protein